MLDDRPKEQAFVPFLERRQQHVSIDVARQSLEVHHDPIDHLSVGGDAIGKESGQAEPISVVPLEGNGSIERLVTEDVKTAPGRSLYLHRDANCNHGSGV